MPRQIGGFDPALQGPDSAVLTVGRAGMASHWIDSTGGQHEFEGGGHRRAVLVEQQIEIQKGDSVAVARALVQVCRPLGIDPECLALDATGTGEGVSSQLRHIWGEVVPVIYSSSATDRKVLTEDRHVASDRYADRATELWFAARSWAEHDLLKVHPGALSQRLQAEIAARRFVVVGQGKVKLRKKEEDQVRGKSPDAADSFTLIVEAARSTLDGPVATMRDLPGRQPTPERTARDLDKSGAQVVLLARAGRRQAPPA